MSRGGKGKKKANKKVTYSSIQSVPTRAKGGLKLKVSGSNRSTKTGLAQRAGQAKTRSTRAGAKAKRSGVIKPARAAHKANSKFQKRKAVKLQKRVKKAPY